jgi:neuronal guanine nucleotide exchange factor
VKFAKSVLKFLSQIVFQCNQAANRCEQAFEMEVLSKQIEFPANITPFPLIPFNPSNRLPRTLVRRGELVHIIYRGDDAKLTFGKKATIKKNIYCFLFTDIMILTKKKRFVDSRKAFETANQTSFHYHSDESFLVIDYCQRSLLQLSSGDVIPQLPVKDINQAGKYIMFMSLLENCIGKPIDLVKHS